MARTEEQKVNKEQKAGGKKPSLLSPEAIGMLFFAGLIDGLEFLFNLIPLRGLPEVLSFVLDLVALIVIGFWMLMRTGGITVPGKAVSRLAKMGKWLKPLCMLVEFLPIGGALAPLWIVAVWLELKT